jgi:hypothetical protein
LVLLGVLLILLVLILQKDLVLIGPNFDDKVFLAVATEDLGAFVDIDVEVIGISTLLDTIGSSKDLEERSSTDMDKIYATWKYLSKFCCFIMSSSLAPPFGTGLSRKRKSWSKDLNWSSMGMSFLWITTEFSSLTKYTFFISSSVSFTQLNSDAFLLLLTTWVNGTWLVTRSFGANPSLKSSLPSKLVSQI